MTVTDRTYQWVIGVILALLFSMAGALFGSTAVVGPVKQELRDHESLKSHPVTEAQLDQLNRRLERFEDKLDIVLDRLPPRDDP